MSIDPPQLPEEACPIPGMFIIEWSCSGGTGVGDGAGAGAASGMVMPGLIAA
jgi:hypothetical protein